MSKIGRALRGLSSQFKGFSETSKILLDLVLASSGVLGTPSDIMSSVANSESGTLHNLPDKVAK